MKKIIILLITVSSFSFGLSGLAQIKMEKVYDTFRTKHLEGRNAEEQSSKIKAIQKALSVYINHPKVPASAKESYDYLRHLFCEAESIINGLVCQDNYTPAGPLTTDIQNMTLTSIRKTLIAEHSKRRIQRSLGGLRESEKLNTIAQKYALELCKAGYITHELGGSQLGERYDNEGYEYSLGGENLGSGQTTVAQILDQLTTSLHHRENMYEGSFTEIGVGQCQDIWVLNYGKPSL